jgi:hypothetical protein
VPTPWMRPQPMEAPPVVGGHVRLHGHRLQVLGSRERGFQMSNLIVLVLFAALLFLILREVVCWYWKLNEIVKVLGQIRESLDDKKIILYKQPEDKL